MVTSWPELSEVHMKSASKISVAKVTFLAGINSVLCYLLGEGWENVSCARLLGILGLVHLISALFLSNKEVFEFLKITTENLLI